ncbi:MAG: alpha/beta hydrolase-fold protein [Gammaproteobacteria bacterium]|nr:alpha/beta hydrolase-fold protein [Gammaproteobacteria bacterium]MDH4254411.1 alpha/beta hydrolase-fold protein [Gammaproteobacteria bacterium]MDH5310758.1 alpha/beta hydrolase-fold protein [Gammaproteobacteria bacterium]
MKLPCPLARIVYLLLTVLLAAGCGRPAATSSPDFRISYAGSAAEGPIDGRMLLILAADDDAEPRFKLRAGVDAAQIFGIDVDALMPGQDVVIDETVFGYPHDSLADLPDGEYVVQALLHRYETFTLENGKTVKLPMDRGEGQRWNRAPGNLYSTPATLSVSQAAGTPVRIVLDQVIPPIDAPTDTKYVRHVRIKSELLSRFWGRDMYLGAHVLLPEGFDEHPDARYPLLVFHGHFPADFGGFREQPPDENLECEYSERFQLDCYNRIEQQEAYDFFRTWTGPNFPRMLIIEIQHANPYYDDSYAVNSANLGPWGDAITHELIPYIEQTFRGIGAGWARFLYGGSTGGWEAMAAQVFYPDEYNGAFVACPDPIDFRAFVSVDMYEDDNAYFDAGPFNRLPRPEHRNWLGHVSVMMEDENHMELVLGENSRSGGQYDIWEAVYSPMGDAGYPKRAWNKRTGEIDHTVTDYWRENYDLMHILRRDWATLGPKLEGKLHIYVGDMDNYYLNNAVYLAEDFLENTTEPYYGGEVDYGDRAEHCWNGDHDNPNAISRLRYNSMYVPKILRRIEASAPEGADLTSWRY